jgi:2,4-dienoyl-CoA reductase-like NADH-dependent reductase (Old Yellow Enzyme family)
VALPWHSRPAALEAAPPRANFVLPNAGAAEKVAPALSSPQEPEPVPNLFDPLKVGPLTLPNRIAVSPMCQYSAADGSATDWHLQHLMQFAVGRAGMVVVEATAVERIGRITHKCLGLYSDDNEAALARVIKAAKAIAAPGTCFAIQLAHAGRKASVQPPFEGAQPLRPDENPWLTVAPSAVPFSPEWHTPRALDAAGLEGSIASFQAAAERSVRVGFDAIELHAAHGYLLHQFLSPLANQRTDNYCGTLENRMRFPLQVAAAIRAVVPRSVALGARISGSDWADAGFDIADAVAFSRALKSQGYDYVCVSSGNVVASKIPFAPGFQVPLAEQVRAGAGLVTRAVGMIIAPAQAQEIISTGKADMVALARAFLDDPRWVWHAAERLGASVSYPAPYARVAPAVWPGAAIARAGAAAPAS